MKKGDRHRKVLCQHPSQTAITCGASPPFSSGQSTADYDRGGKFTHYRRLPSLQEYVLISQDRPLVEHYVRQAQDEWVLTERSSLDETLVLPTIGCRLALSEIYLKVRFSAEDGGPVRADETDGA